MARISSTHRSGSARAASFASGISWDASSRWDSPGSRKLRHSIMRKHMLPLKRPVFALFATALVISACSDDNGNTGPAPAPGAAVINADITASRTLFADTTYTLSGYIKVANGAVLTIEPGTQIVGDTTAPGSSLWILRGAR